MPRSRNRYSRTAMRAKYRKPSRGRRSGSMGWNVAIATIVMVFVAALVLTKVDFGNSSASAVAPQAANQSAGKPGDHWHTYLGVNVCGEWLSPAPPFEKAFDNQSSVSNVGIHSHGDGLIHTHPFVTSEEGDHATLGHYLDNGGWSISSDEIDVSGGYKWAGPSSDPNNRDWVNGDKCTFGEFKGKKGELIWGVDGKKRTGNPSDYKVEDGATITVAFLPEGSELPFPPGACNAFATISDQQTQAVVSKDSPCRTPTESTAPASTPSSSTP